MHTLWLLLPPHRQDDQEITAAIGADKIEIIASFNPSISEQLGGRHHVNEADTNLRIKGNIVGVVRSVQCHRLVIIPRITVVHEQVVILEDQVIGPNNRGSAATGNVGGKMGTA